MNFALNPNEIAEILKPMRNSYELGIPCSGHFFYHCNHHHLTRSVVRKLLININELTEEMHLYDEPEMRAPWYYGRLTIQLVLEVGLWHPRDCRLCYLSRFLTGWGIYPWLVGLKLLGEEEIYQSCLRGLKKRGLGRESWVQWVEEVVRKFNEMKTMERKRENEICRRLGEIRIDGTISETYA